MPGVVHGGQVFVLARRLGRAPAQILDFSASINPLGPPPAALAAARAALADAVHYPDLHAAPLVDDLAACHGLAADCLLAGAGATEFIFLVPRVLQARRALVVAPAFGEYAVALRQAGTDVDLCVLDPEQDFAFCAETVCRRLTPTTDLVVLANPANPTGQALSRSELTELLERLPAGVVLLLDEAFIDFCPEHSLLDQVGRRSNLLVLRSLTKFYAIPGLRVGFLAGAPALMARLAACREPWRLSVPAIAAARACLAEPDYPRQSLAAMAEWRRELAEGLARLGLQVYPAAANYLLCRLPAGSGPVAALTEQLAEQAILVRDCSDFAGLGSDFLRIAVRQPADNRMLLDALASALKDKEEG